MLKNNLVETLLFLIGTGIISACTVLHDDPTDDTTLIQSNFPSSWEYRSIINTNLDLPLPRGTTINPSRDSHNITEAIMDNLPDDQYWHGWTLIRFVNYTYKNYDSVNDYLDHVCDKDPAWKGEKNTYKIKWQKRISDIDVYEIELSCLRHPPYYTEALQTEFLFWYKDHLIMAYLDGESEPYELELFRKAIAHVKISEGPSSQSK